MHELPRRIRVYAAPGGLVLQAVPQKHQRGLAAASIDYKTHKITSLATGWQPEDDAQLPYECHGVVGLLSVRSASYIILITRREQVAEIRQKPIFVISGVAIVPLSSQGETSDAIAKLRSGTGAKSKSVDSRAITDDSDDDVDYKVIISDEEVESATLQPTTPFDNGNDESETSFLPSATHRKTSVAEDVISRKGKYGRFMGKWFSSQGWTVEKRRAQGMSGAEASSAAPQDSTKGPAISGQGADDRSLSSKSKSIQESIPASHGEDSLQSSSDGVAINLLPKFLHATKMLFSSRNFFYSYDHDITRAVAFSRSDRDTFVLPKSVDPLFFWNQHLALPFSKAHLDWLVLPIMQGFVGQRLFNVSSISAVNSLDGGDDTDIELRGWAEPDGHDTLKHQLGDRAFTLTLISRRSVERAGLRYLRRGVDDEGHTANTVETEQILSVPVGNASTKDYSFVQIRGSIPLYFYQSPYSFKPVPVLQRSSATNDKALRKHFEDLERHYGAVQIASLVSKHGTESILGKEYEIAIDKLNDFGLRGPTIGFEWFDFHEVCRGMKFENVSLLLDALEDTLSKFGATEAIDGKIQSRQKGVLRTNCMDCLDRTNVTQSACGRRALETQLQQEGIELNLQAIADTHWFDTLWADNGDAISRQYTSTAALKGDYTRTRKRDYRGAINDFGLSVSRYFNNIVNDYFLQAAIDYLLGNVNVRVFEEFDVDMMSADPAMSMDKVRQSAIETSSKIVIADSAEELIGGWALLSPQEENTIRTFPFEEVIILLTEVAIYVCRFDWNMEKVSSFRRVDLKNITTIQHGTYIISTLAATHTNEKHNYGFLIKFVPAQEDFKRVNTRSMSVYTKTPDSKSSPAGSADDEAETLASAPAAGPSTSSQTPAQDTNRASPASPPTTHLIAFKALPARTSLSKKSRARSSDDSHDPNPPALSESELAQTIAAEIERAAVSRQRGWRLERRAVVEERDIISLARARKSTGLFEQLGYAVKKMVWA